MSILLPELYFCQNTLLQRQVDDSPPGLFSIIGVWRGVALPDLCAILLTSKGRFGTARLGGHCAGGSAATYRLSSASSSCRAARPCPPLPRLPPVPEDCRTWRWGGRGPSGNTMRLALSELGAQATGGGGGCPPASCLNATVAGGVIPACGGVQMKTEGQSVHSTCVGCRFVEKVSQSDDTLTKCVNPWGVGCPNIDFQKM